MCIEGGRVYRGKKAYSVYSMYKGRVFIMCSVYRGESVYSVYRGGECV